MKYKKETIEKVSQLLSSGFNSTEISEKLKLHKVTIRQIKLQLKKGVLNENSR